ncbi:hypothetical protein [Gilliamella apicola]|uniref:hypothetical protein n=1 Tax=Gilliamella apicola TaxID=1196095 RepID=UPI00080E6B39|nr:hypothetical protein [Gilliamella apicola]OCG12395.1 hypothetical protein A9G14_05675 [Gilliamella apicola]
MKNKLQKLLDEYQENYNRFTYGHYLDPKVRISIQTGQLCPHTGVYSAQINGKIEYRELIQGYKVEPFIDSETQQVYNDVTWQLLRRENGGNVYRN